MERKFKCCICEKICYGYGNNPYPISKDQDDVCCDNCNTTKVIPARVQKLCATDLDTTLGE